MSTGLLALLFAYSLAYHCLCAKILEAHGAMKKKIIKKEKGK